MNTVTPVRSQLNVTLTMDIDKLFKVNLSNSSNIYLFNNPSTKVPKLPASGSKRKMPDNPTPEMLKKMKLDISPPSVPENGSHKPKGKPRTVTIQDEDEEDIPADFAPGGDADYFVEEDDEGRFFGGGLTTEQKTILNIFDDAGGEGVQEDVSKPFIQMHVNLVLNLSHDQFEELSITAIRRLLNQLDRAVKKNQDQRSKYPDDPSK